MEANQAPLNIFKEEIIESEENTVSLNVYVKQELYEDDYSVNVIGDLIGETKGLSSIKQEENIDLKTDIILEESNGSIKLESNSIDNSENKLNYSIEKRRIPELEDTTDEVQSNIYPQKRFKKGHLDIRTKEMVLDVYKHEISENPTMVIHDVERSVAAQTGVCPKTVFNIMKEYKQNNKFSAPKRKLRYKQICDTVEDYHKKAIRYKVYEFFFRNELPSIDKVLKDVNDDPLLPSFKRGTFYKLLKILNFRFKTRGKMSLLLDRDEIVLWRRKYLQDIKRYRREDRKIYYLDGTWIDAEKGKRFIICHIGSREGFVPNALWTYNSKKSGDYNEGIESFENWFSNILPKLDDNCVIVLNNDPYHSRKLEKIPTTASKTEDIKKWLREKNIKFDQSMLQVQLMCLVKQHKKQYDKYVIDEMSKQQNKTILRLPPYHCDLNPMELIWDEVKQYVSNKNSTFKFGDMKTLFEEGIALISPKKWKKCVEHVCQKVELKMWELDNIIETQTEPVVIAMNGDSSSDLSDLSELE